METLILMAIIFFVVNRLAKSTKNKNTGANRQQQQPQNRQQPQAAQQPSSRKQQSIEEQRRRRAAYEAAQRQQQDMLLELDTTVEETVAPDHVEEPRRRDIDAEYHYRQAEARKAEERKLLQQRKRQISKHYGTLEQYQGKKPRPQSLEQAQRQLYTPLVEQPVIQAADPGQTRPSPSVAQPIQTQILGGQSRLNMDGNTWMHGIVMAEILGPPRAKKRQIR